MDYADPPIDFQSLGLIPWGLPPHANFDAHHFFGEGTPYGGPNDPQSQPLNGNAKARRSEVPSNPLADPGEVLSPQSQSVNDNPKATRHEVLPNPFVEPGEVLSSQSHANANPSVRQCGEGMPQSRPSDPFSHAHFSSRQRGEGMPQSRPSDPFSHAYSSSSQFGEGMPQGGPDDPIYQRLIPMNSSRKYEAKPGKMVQLDFATRSTNSTLDILDSLARQLEKMERRVEVLNYSYTGTRNDFDELQTALTRQGKRLSHVEETVTSADEEVAKVRECLESLETADETRRALIDQLKHRVSDLELAEANVNKTINGTEEHGKYLVSWMNRILKDVRHNTSMNSELQKRITSLNECAITHATAQMLEELENRLLARIDQAAAHVTSTALVPQMLDELESRILAKFNQARHDSPSPSRSDSGTQTSDHPATHPACTQTSKPEDDESHLTKDPCYNRTPVRKRKKRQRPRRQHRRHSAPTELESSTTGSRQGTGSRSRCEPDDSNPSKKPTNMPKASFLARDLVSRSARHSCPDLTKNNYAYHRKPSISRSSHAQIQSQGQRLRSAQPLYPLAPRIVPRTPAHWMLPRPPSYVRPTPPMHAPAMIMPPPRIPYSTNAPPPVFMPPLVMPPPPRNWLRHVHMNHVNGPPPYGTVTRPPEHTRFGHPVLCHPFRHPAPPKYPIPPHMLPANPRFGPADLLKARY